MLKVEYKWKRRKMDENMSLAWSKSMKGLLMEKLNKEGLKKLGGDI